MNKVIKFPFLKTTPELIRMPANGHLVSIIELALILSKMKLDKDASGDKTCKSRTGKIHIGSLVCTIVKVAEQSFCVCSVKYVLL